MADIYGTPGDDTLIGGAGKDYILAGDGNDYVESKGVQDTVFGGAGDDTLVSTSQRYDYDVSILNGGDGNDVLTGKGTLDGGDGDDSINTPAASSIIGGLGNDTAFFSDPASGFMLVASGADTVIVRKANSLESAIRMRGVETLNFNGIVVDVASASIGELILGSGSGSADSLTGSAFGDYISAEGGSDTVSGGDGDDMIFGSGSGDFYIADSLDGGDGNDTIFDTFGANTITGGAGNDTITGSGHIMGGAGNDSIVFEEGAYTAGTADGGDGNDYIRGGHPGWLVTLNGGGGADTLTGSGTLYGGDGNDGLFGQADSHDLLVGGAGRDNLAGGHGNDTLDGGDDDDQLAGNGGADSLIGGTGSDTIYGDAGDDVLDGGLGFDDMHGGQGNDLFRVDQTGERTVEFIGYGNDTVEASLSWTLSAEVENLILTGSADLTGTGNGLANRITGNGGANVLSGGAGNDTILGGARWDTLLGGEGNDTLEGGTGNDQMSGGLGDDLYYVDHVGDRVLESAVVNEGSDTVYASISWNLTANVEAAILTGDGNTSSTGNSLANTITGNGGNNSLTGGSGNDTLYGLGGNDSLWGGLDSDVLDGGAGDDALRAGDRWDTLTGGDGNDWLDGGDGNDRMSGNAGNDTYLVDDAGDRVIELAGEGIDTVMAYIDFALSANVENLVMSGLNLTGTGNGLDNRIEGNSSGTNRLYGGHGNDTLGGGIWSDTLTGGTGRDHFTFGQFSGATDVVTDFVHEVDRLVFSAQFYGDIYSIPKGHKLSDAEFTYGTTAVGYDQQFVWDAATGQLWWDENGARTGKAHLVAILEGGASLSKEDIDFV